MTVEARSSARSHSSRAGRADDGSAAQAGIGLEQVQRRELARGEALGDRASIPTGLAASSSESPGPAFGSTPASRSPRPLAPAGISSRPAPSVPASGERLRELEQRPGGRGAVGAGGQALAPQDHDLLAGLRQLPGELVDARVVEQLRGAGLEQAQAVAAHALAQAQVEDRHVLERVGVEHEHRVGELEVGDLRLQRGLGQRAVQLQRQRAGAARVEVRGAEALAQQAREQQALLVGGLPAGDRAGALAGAREARRRPPPARAPRRRGAARRRRAAAAR